MKIVRIICWQVDSTLRQTMKRGFDIIPAVRPELISYHFSKVLLQAFCLGLVARAQPTVY
jgi:hypothetical protein